MSATSGWKMAFGAVATGFAVRETCGNSAYDEGMDVPSPLIRIQTGSRLWLWPRVALALFIAAVGSLLWYSHREERAEQREVLISDVLWLEQDLRFQFNQLEERLRQLLPLAGDSGQPMLSERARFLVQNTPGLSAVQLWHDDGRLLFASVPPPAVLTAHLQNPLKLARVSAHAVFAEPLRSGNEVLLAVLLHDREHTAVALVSLPRLVDQQVPWWFAHRYRMVLLDWHGQLLAGKSAVESGAASLSYQLPLDPPGRGVTLQVTAYRTPSSLTRNLLVASVIGLAVLVLYSWWRLRRNLQARLQAETALREEHAFRKAMEDSLAVGMRARDLNGRIIYVNPAFCRMVGYRADELIGSMPPHPYWDPADLATHERISQDVLSGNAPPAGFETSVRHKDGHIVPTMVYTAPLIDAGGQQRGWMSSVVDISEQRRIEALTRRQEEKLQQTARLVTMGEMASTLAHELNQPLAALSGYASAAAKLAQQPAQQGLLLATLSKLGEQAQRAAQIVRRIRDFVGRRDMQRELIDLNDAVRDAVALVQAEASQRHVTLQLQLADDLPRLLADRILLQQVLLNLIHNALDACSLRQQAQIGIQTRQQGNNLEVSVTDNGRGIDPADSERLFDAFFTTKPQGMGMGLAICRSIVENHHGRLWFEAAPDGGSIFHFSIPL